MPVTAVRDEGALRMWVCRLPVHIGPAGRTVFYEKLRQIRDFPMGRQSRRPLQLARERPGLPRQCENQIMLGCQQSGVSRPIMVTMVGATLARP